MCVHFGETAVCIGMTYNGYYDSFLCVSKEREPAIGGLHVMVCEGKHDQTCDTEVQVEQTLCIQRDVNASPNLQLVNLPHKYI